MQVIKRYQNWHSKLTPIQQLCLSFMFNWSYWFIAWQLATYFHFLEERSYGYAIFHATWMAFFSTIPFNRNEIGKILRSVKRRTV